jgi:RimJ/RimL family protein N-acetyltransferase
MSTAHPDPATPVADEFIYGSDSSEGVDETPRLRAAQPDDLGTVFAMRNLLEIVRWTESGREVTLDEHRAWFASRIAGGDNRLYLIEVEGTPAGSLDLARRHGEVIISIYLLSPLRGRGHGRRLIRESCDTARACWGPVTLVARILSDNEPSLHAFGAAGFAETSSEGRVIVMKQTVAQAGAAA